MHKLRSLLPPELAGVVILPVAIGNGMVGDRYLSAEGAQHADPRHWAVATITLLAAAEKFADGLGAAEHAMDHGRYRRRMARAPRPGRARQLCGVTTDRRYRQHMRGARTDHPVRQLR